jgi:hypothetical protein
MMNPLKLDNKKQIFFYEQDHYYLSNFSAFTLQWKGWRFDTSEAAYQWEKFAYMNNANQHECNICYAIRWADSAHNAFKIAESNKFSISPSWNKDKLEVMRMILREKANQHEYVRRKILQTGDLELIENSWRDNFWGWGLNRDGQNMLGKIWMEIRSELCASLNDGKSAGKK